MNAENRNMSIPYKKSGPDSLFQTRFQTERKAISSHAVICSLKQYPHYNKITKRNVDTRPKRATKQKRRKAMQYEQKLSKLSSPLTYLHFSRSLQDARDNTK